METQETYVLASSAQLYSETNLSGALLNSSNGSLTEDFHVNDHHGMHHTSITFERIFYIYIVPVLVVIGTVGNSLILLTVRQHNMRHWSICFYLTAYAVVNIFILVPMTGVNWLCQITDTRYITLISNITCKLWTIVMDVVTFSGIWFVFAMLVDQYIAIWLPLKAQSMCTIFMAKFATTIIIIGLIVISIHAIWMFELFPNGCFLHENEDLLALIWPWVSLSCYCIIPLVLIIIFIGLVVYGVFTKSTWKKTSSNYQVPIDITFMIIGLSVFFILLIIPQTVLDIIKRNLPRAWLAQEFYLKLQIAALIGELLTYLNPTLAFFVCFTFSSTFRTELREILKSLFCKHMIRVYEMQVNSNGNSGNEFENCSETTPL